MTKSNAFPMVELNIGRAHALNRDKRDSVEAYRRFLVLWRNADQNQPLMLAAMSKSK